MKLRELKIEDAPLMLKWMQDSSVVAYMDADFNSKTIKDCEAFIENIKKDGVNFHMAIVDDHNLYMGTVSLKNINKVNKSAEFAIIMGKNAMGKGYSKFGMDEIIRIGFEDMGLNQIYWCVSPKNKRAIRFYEKNGFKKVTDFIQIWGKDASQKRNSYIWYREVNSRKAN